MLLRSTSEVEWFQDFIWDERIHEWRPGVRARYPDKRISFLKAAEDENGQLSSPAAVPKDNNTFASVIVIFNHHNKTNHYQQQEASTSIHSGQQQQLQLSDFLASE
jgi:hypothetical protein